MAESKDTHEDQVQGRVDPSANGEEVCDPCKVDNNIQPAVGWCETCDEMLCNDCYMYHCRLRMMKNHQLMSVVDMKDLKQRKRVSIKCDKHEGEPLRYFCEDHAELGCNPCLVTKHRSCSSVVYIADVKTNESKELKALETLLSRLNKRLKASEARLERNVGSATRQHDKAIADIKEAGEKLKAHIDTIVKQQILKAQTRKEDTMTNMNSNKERNNYIARKLKTGKEMLVGESNNNNRLFVTMKFVQREAEMLKSKLLESEKEMKVQGYEFELCSELADVLEKVKHLGALQDTQLLNVEKATNKGVDVVEVRRFQQPHTRWLTYAPSASNEDTIRDAIRVSTDHNIRLLHILVYALKYGDTEVALTIREGGRCLISCNSTYQREAGHEVVAVDVDKKGGAHGITLQAGHQYVIDVTSERGLDGNFYGVHGLSTVTEKGVKLTFNKTNSITVHPGIIVGLRFTIM